MRTRARVQEAILAAASAGDIADLTVAEIARRADVHRVTFYKHWETAAAAVTDAFTQIVDELAEVTFDQADPLADPGRVADAYRAALDRQVREIIERRTTYRHLFALAGGAFAASVESALRARADLAVAELARAGTDVPGAADGTAAAYVAAGVTAALRELARSDATDVPAAAAAIEAQLPRWWPAPSNPQPPAAIERSRRE